MKPLETEGWMTVSTGLSQRVISTLAETLFHSGVAGTRCLLDVPAVADTAIQLRENLIRQGLLSAGAVAVQAIAFDKTASSNWKVTWHQDVMFPLAAAPMSPEFDLPTKKDGVDYARPPRRVLEEMLAVRVHLDDCDETNGPLRVSPGSHRSGILKSTAIADQVRRNGEQICTAKQGEALLMKPLLLHASSPAKTPRRRRVLHVVFHSGGLDTERWHRTI